MVERDAKEDWLGRLMGVAAPWRVVRVSAPEGDPDGFVEVEVAHGGGGFACAVCGAPAQRHDARQRTWRDLDLHQRKTKVVAQVPRTKCAEHGVRFVSVPWADRGARFTAMFESAAIDLLRECSVRAAARRMGLSWAQAAGIQRRAVQRGLARQETRSPRRIGVDETSFRKRHQYVTVVNDPASGAVLSVAEGRGKDALSGFFRQMPEADAMALEVVAMDMHRPYILAVRENSLAAVAFDKFHVAQGLSRAIDQVRRAVLNKLGAAASDLKRTRYLWLMSGAALTDEKRARLDDLCGSFAPLAEAWRLKEWALTLWEQGRRPEVEAAWRQWLAQAEACKLAPMRKMARTVREHLQGIVTAVCTGITNARAESVNSKIQWIKRMGCGYRRVENFMAAILFHLGQLDLRPHTGWIPQES